MGGRFNFGPVQAANGPQNDEYFGIAALIGALQASTTPIFQVDRAHRLGHVFTGVVTGSGNHDHVDCSVNRRAIVEGLAEIARGAHRRAG
jgi:hypothetical protein